MRSLLRGRRESSRNLCADGLDEPRHRREQLLDVGARPGVAEEAVAFAAVDAAVVPESRRGAVEHPAVLAVAAAQAVLDLERAALVGGGQAGLTPARQVVRVDGPGPAFAQRLLERATGVLEPRRTGEFARQVGSGPPGHRKDAVVG